MVDEELLGRLLSLNLERAVAIRCSFVCHNMVVTLQLYAIIAHLSIISPSVLTISAKLSIIAHQ